MTRRLPAAVGAAFLMLMALAAAPAALAGDPCFHGYTIPPTTTEATDAVAMELCAFVPTNVQVAQGSTVTFTNTTGEVHLLTGANQEWGDREKEIQPGAVVSMTFDGPGVYSFSCTLHTGMSGAVIVGEAEGQAAPAAAVSPAASTPDRDALAAVAIVGLAAMAAIGWATALVQRRRPATEPQSDPRVPAA
jgi:plastocyanin